MKLIQRYLLILLVAITGISCSDFLEVSPQGVIGDEALNSPENIDGLVIAAYAMLVNAHHTVPNQLWPWRDLRS